MNQPITNLTYQPAPAKPAWFDDAVTRLRGLNPLGEPQWRVVWGMDQFISYGDEGEGIKYPEMAGPLGPGCWLLEGWRAPEFFGTPEDWAEVQYGWEDGKRVTYLRDYPSRGEYWLIRPFVALKGGQLCYVPLGEEAYQFLEIIKKNQDEYRQTPSNEALYGKQFVERARMKQEQKDANADLQSDLLYEDYLLYGDAVNNRVERGGQMAQQLKMYGPKSIPSDYQIKTNPESIKDAQKFLKAQESLLVESPLVQ